MGPYEIDTIYDNGSMKLCTIVENRTPLMANGHRLRLYQKPMSKEEFIEDLIKQEKLEVVSEVAMPPMSTSS
jgi:hypothetical protein